MKPKAIKSHCCGLIKDLKTRYFFTSISVNVVRCGLIKDLKTRYYIFIIIILLNCCGLIKDLKTRYSLEEVEPVVAVVV